MFKVKSNFADQTIYVGLDVHKRSWNAALFLNDQYLRNIHQPPSPQALHTYLHNHYPDARYVCAYESGKFGYWIQRQLIQKNIECIVVNPADIPSAQKDDLQKTDPRDARGIAKALQSGLLKSIYIPSVQQEADRSLVRQRKKIWCDLVRCKNRIKNFLDYAGVQLPAKFNNSNWSCNFIQWLNELPFEQTGFRSTLNYMIREMELLRKELLSISNDIRRLMRSAFYKNKYYLLRTVSGIGPLTAALLTEIWDMKRFSSFYELNSFIGLMPMEHSSGDKELKGRLTIRKHRQLRCDLIECAWAAKRTDPALSLYYHEQLKKGKEPKLIIVKIARKLLSRIRYVWLSEKPYQTAVVK
ncbi:IS110 family transposase [Terrimonas alba]|uniref:IS110 family transposase n=1 Tax=Terrimonas alba TaxID=3349636 RepID=UPI0035F25D4F